MGPPETEGVELGPVVVVVEVDVVVEVGGEVVVVVEDVVPPPPPPPPPPPLGGATVVAVGATAVGVAVGATAVTVDQRFTSPENWSVLDSDSNVLTTLNRIESEFLPPKADADASMFTIATRMLAETAKVKIFGMRCEVFARKKFLNESLYMGYKIAFSNHASAYENSKLPQLPSPTLASR